MTRAITFGALLLIGVPTIAAAHGAGEGRIPAFARRYGMSCAACHTIAPALNDFGETFAGNGFRVSATEAPRDTADTGDPLLHLMRDLPLAFRLDAYAHGFHNGDVETDLQTPYNLKILSGGPISGKLSYYLYFFLFERGEIGGVEDAFIYWNDIADRPVDLAIGQFQVSDPMLKRELRLEYQDYAIYRARVGAQRTDLTYDRGLMAVADVGGFTLTAQIVNGNGRGEADATRRFDDSPFKNVVGHVSREIVPALRLGAFGYYGRQDGAATGGPSVRNTIRMFGGDATLGFGPLEINGQYLYREDDRPTFTDGEPVAATKGGFVEALYHPEGARWYAIGLYNRVDANRPLLDVRLGGASGLTRYQTVTGGLGYLVQRNFRTLVEGTYDTETEGFRWTLGLTTAF